ncbi:MAG TPA: DUF418 domain-containing protein [Pyrinomonadaceae bacterium]|nr:DUF418 domain-containing protein [Pyrinomonadaceae bacterium]
MPDSKMTPVSANERLEIVDVLRGLAVCGILVGNVQWFSGYGMVPPSIAEAQSTVNQVVHFLVHFFVEGKFYSIFSFLFGFGFAMQIARAEERGDTKATVFKRRLFWLLVIGLLHAYLLWAGDIVSIYALMGFILLLFRHKTNESLLKWSVAMMIVPIVTYILLYTAFIAFAPPDTAANIQAEQTAGWYRSVATVTQSSYIDILTNYNRDYVIGRYMGLFFQMRLPKILAMFLLGFYAHRIGIFQNLDAHRGLLKKVLGYGLVLGIIGNIMMAGLAGNEAPFPPSPSGALGVIGYAFGVPALALGIIAGVTLLWQIDSWKRLLSVVAPVGRMALTNYLMQTVICVTLFYGYGFGMFGTIGATKATMIALGIFVVQIALSNLWLRYFKYGPVEWIWRQLTYKQRLAIRRERYA